MPSIRPVKRRSMRKYSAQDNYSKASTTRESRAVFVEVFTFSFLCNFRVSNSTCNVLFLKGGTLVIRLSRLCFRALVFRIKFCQNTRRASADNDFSSIPGSKSKG
jgi:hypothetical protein